VTEGEYDETFCTNKTYLPVLLSLSFSSSDTFLLCLPFRTDEGRAEWQIIGGKGKWCIWKTADFQNEGRRQTLKYWWRRKNVQSRQENKLDAVERTHLLICERRKQTSRISTLMREVTYRLSGREVRGLTESWEEDDRGFCGTD